MQHVRDLLAGLDRAGERHAVDARVGDDRARRRRRRPATRFTTPGGSCVEAVGERERRERRQLRRLAHARVAGRQRRRELPGEQQQRVVPRHDAGDDAHRLLDHQRELRGLDRRDHAAREVAAHLGVVVERRRGPADLVGVLDQRLAALARHRLGQLVGPRADAARRPRAASRRARAPASRPTRASAVARRRDRRVDLLLRGRADRREDLAERGVLDLERVARARRPARRRSGAALQPRDHGLEEAALGRRRRQRVEVRVDAPTRSPASPLRAGSATPPPAAARRAARARARARLDRVERHVDPRACATRAGAGSSPTALRPSALAPATSSESRLREVPLGRVDRRAAEQLRDVLDRRDLAVLPRPRVAARRERARAHVDQRQHGGRGGLSNA